MCWGLETVRKWSQSDTESQNLNHLSCDFTSLIEKEMRFLAAKGGPRECAELGNVVKGSKAAAVKGTNQCRGNTLNMAEADTPQHRAWDSCPPWGVRVVMGIGGALPLQARLCTQRAGRCFCPQACRDVTGSSSMLHCNSQHRTCNGGRSTSSHTSTASRCSMLLKLLPGCAAHSSPGRSETTKTFCLIPQGRSSGGGSGGIRCQGGKGPPNSVPCSRPLLGAC